MKIALAQINPTIGDLVGNASIIEKYIDQAQQAGCELILFPELAITGYPPRDLLDKNHFVEDNISTLNEIASGVSGITVIIGYVGLNTAPTGKQICNSCAIVENGKIIATRDKSLLPTYDVFDELRYFEPASSNEPLRLKGLNIAITICEDLWNDHMFGPRSPYHRDPVDQFENQNIDLLLNLSASPYSVGKEKLRADLIAKHAARINATTILCNQVGGNDELVFDGNSLAIKPDGTILARGKSFAEDLLIIDLSGKAVPYNEKQPTDLEQVYQALVLGTRDYARKCGFTKAVIGLSGGIDSALVAAIAAEALGPEHITGIGMPTRYSSDGSKDDAQELADRLGITYREFPIETIFAQYLKEFELLFPNARMDVTEENIQARIRGNILMAVSNKNGYLVLSTGNKSEMSTGYSTLYGDMCGGLAVISDVPKTMVYDIARQVVNQTQVLIPEATITKPPSAELRPDQKDSDSLPDYEILDAILREYIENGKSPEHIIDLGFGEDIVNKTVHLLKINEYKRRQAPPGLRVTSKAFGMGRRVPIAQRYPR